MLADSEILFHALHVLLVSPLVIPLPHGAHPIWFHRRLNTRLALVEMTQHLRVVRVPLEHVATHLSEVALPGCLGEVGGHRDRFRGRREDEGLWSVDVEWVKRGARFKWKGCGEVVEVPEAGLRGGERGDVFKIAEVEVGWVKSGLAVAVRAWR